MNGDGWPVIDPAGLSPSQQAGQRCVVPNCRRRLRRGDGIQIGVLPNGRPALACFDCAPTAAPGRAA